MPFEVFLQTLKDLQRGALRLGAALGLVALGVTALARLFSNGAPGWLDRLIDRPAGLPGAGGTAWLSGAGFLLIFPLFLCVYAIWTGSALIAGEERSGTLELLLSYPLPRLRLMLEKFGALALALLLLASGLWALLALGASVLGLGVPLGNLAGACAGLYLLALFFGGLAFALSTWLSKPARSRLVAALALAAAYLLSAVWLHGVVFLRYLSPFYYAAGREPLANGLPAGHAVALAALAAACITAAGVVFERRDLAV